MKAHVYTQTGEDKGEIDLNPEIFGIKMNKGLVHDYLLLQQANLRRPIAHTKTPGEVSGTGKKPHKQKGTGKARLGSKRSVQQRGGGVVHGPRSNRNFSVMMPQKQRRKALFCLLSDKARNTEIIVLESYDNKKIGTKDFAEMLKKLPIERNSLVVIAEKNEIIQKSSRNLSRSKTILANYLNPKDLLGYKTLVVLKDSLEKIEEVFLKKKTKVS
ncbi:MAG: 50S ribosomal protein L4 [uncultured bacterium]|nr:MAG: 50S ribosomal protein L4 [uncultured bacterium]KKT75101.1 MAG: 50S ribosomal protein L4 [Candidatus Peregrinibacteria bacterium GW2011_GWA2_44_7]